MTTDRPCPESSKPPPPATRPVGEPLRRDTDRGMPAVVPHGPEPEVLEDGMLDEEDEPRVWRPEPLGR